MKIDPLSTEVGPTLRVIYAEKMDKYKAIRYPPAVRTTNHWHILPDQQILAFKDKLDWR